MSSAPGRFRFGPFVVERAAYRVLKDGVPVTATPKLVDVLLHFVSRPSLLVSKEELLTAIWPGVAVTDNAVTQAISDLRQLLGDDPASPTYIQTVARRGYRFIAPVEALPPSAAGEMPSAVEPVLPGESGMVRSVAVLSFSNVTADPDLDWLSTGIAETVTNDLTAFRVLRVVDRVRVAEATRRTDGSLTAVARDLGVSLAAVGSFQRVGEQLRITARLVDVASGATMADAKVDGRLDDVFGLQDRIVRQFSAALGVEGAYGQSTRVGARETANLEAFRAASEARVMLDSLNPAELEKAVRGFEHAVRLDPRYALAYAGLANAHFLLYEATRAQARIDTDRLATAIGYARRAIDLNDTLAEAHATLSFLLVSAGRFAEAVTTARRAVALDPHEWRHLFRLGWAAWGSERLDALTRALGSYGEIAFAYFAMAMVHIARGRLELAAETLRQGTPLQDRQSGRTWRYPASGLHWLLGLVLLAQGEADEALGEFRRELESGSATSLYRTEFAMNAWDGRGFALLALRRHDEAADAFEHALGQVPGHARSYLGLASCLLAAGRKDDARERLERAGGAIAELAASGRLLEAAMLGAMNAVVRGRPTDAIALLDRLLTEAPPGFPGWTIPIEPLLKPLHGQPEYGALLERLADRAR
jgi:DNA-binding winged helix-turn-helix (wHTH) protein/tetratricopeptide (TPR) repeat protein